MNKEGLFSFSVYLLAEFGESCKSEALASAIMLRPGRVVSEMQDLLLACVVLN